MRIAMHRCFISFLLTRLCEARRQLQYAVILNSPFLLTRLCEARPHNDFDSDMPIGVSTHAPLRGATRNSQHAASGKEFLLTRLCEARQEDVCFAFFPCTFLLTRLCEARRALIATVLAWSSFYSRASARRDEKNEE